MALDIHDKLQIDTSIKLTFPGVDIKEIKFTKQIEVEESSRKRVIVEPAPADPDLCGMATAIKTDGNPSMDPAKQDIVLIVVKLAKLDANKGILPVLIGNKPFRPADAPKDKDSFKLEGEGSVAFWQTEGDKFKVVSDTSPVYVFNPNKVQVVLDIYYGIAKAAGGGAGKGDVKKDDKKPQGM